MVNYQICILCIIWSAFWELSDLHTVCYLASVLDAIWSMKYALSHLCTVFFVTDKSNKTCSLHIISIQQANYDLLTEVDSVEHETNRYIMYIQILQSQGSHTQFFNLKKTKKLESLEWFNSTCINAHTTTSTHQVTTVQNITNSQAHDAAVCCFTFSCVIHLKKKKKKKDSDQIFSLKNTHHNCSSTCSWARKQNSDTFYQGSIRQALMLPWQSLLRTKHSKNFI